VCVSVSDSQKQQPQQIISTTHFRYFYYTQTTRTTLVQLLSSHGVSASVSPPPVAKHCGMLTVLPYCTKKSSRLLNFLCLFFPHSPKCSFHFLCLCFGPRFVHCQYCDVGLSSFGGTHTHTNTRSQIHACRSSRERQPKKIGFLCAAAAAVVAV